MAEPHHATSQAPLAGLTVIEMSAIGPVPYCGMLLADMGAEVIRIDRIEPAHLGIEVPPLFDVPSRGKSSIAIDLKQEPAKEIALRLIARADVVLEGFRPGVMERLGLGPDRCLQANPALIYGRASGWGQKGELASRAGHDLNFLALSGALGAMGAAGTPPPVPLNLIGDYGGGALHLACGVLAALVSRGRDGCGQVVETSVLRGATMLTAPLHGLLAAGVWTRLRGENVLDGGAPYYRCYETSDGRHVAVAAIEAKFYEQLLVGLGLDGSFTVDAQNDRASWPEVARAFDRIFRSRTRDAWAAAFSESDACVSPVLDPHEATEHPQHAANGSFIDVGGVRQPGLACDFSNVGASLPTSPLAVGADTEAVLRRIGYDGTSIEALRAAGVIAEES